MTLSAVNTAEEWLTLSEASRLLGVHPATLRQWGDEGKIGLYRTPGGHRRFARPEIERLLHVLPVRGAGLSNFVATETLQHTRQELGGARAQQPWMQQLDDEQREHWRLAGRRLVALVSQLINGDPTDEQRTVAHTLGQTYGTLLARAGLDLPDAVLTFIFFRDSLLETVWALPATTGYDRALTVVSVRRINGVLNDVLRVMMAAWGEEREQ